MKLLPDGFSTLLAPAAALPALLPRLLPRLVPADPVVTAQGADPQGPSCLRPAEPPWASAAPVLASASANPIAAGFIAVFLLRCRHKKNGDAARRSRSYHYDSVSLTVVAALAEATPPMTTTGKPDPWLSNALIMVSDMAHGRAWLRMEQRRGPVLF
jgi:hypothetical protein